MATSFFRILEARGVCIRHIVESWFKKKVLPIPQGFRLGIVENQMEEMMGNDM